MGYKYSQQDLLAQAVELSLDEGIGALTFGKLAKRLGIPDRTIVYYFPSKETLILAVLQALGDQLQEVLAETFVETIPDHKHWLRAAWPILTSERADPVFKIFFESAGLAMRGAAPFVQVVPMILAAWVELLMPLLDVPADKQRAEADAAVALLDGLLLMRHLMGDEAAQRAAGCLGVLTA
jgi:AcrR family transcriptional regulator